MCRQPQHQLHKLPLWSSSRLFKPLSPKRTLCNHSLRPL